MSFGESVFQDGEAAEEVVHFSVTDGCYVSNQMDSPLELALVGAADASTLPLHLLPGQGSTW